MRKKIKIIFLFLILFVPAVCYFKFRQPSFIVSSDSVKPSDDQARLINVFGYPDTFTLAMEEKERVEIWKYYGLERAYFFKNGVFINDQIIDPQESFEAHPQLRPTQFEQGLELEEVNQMLKSSPDVQAKVIPAIVKEAEIYSYDEQLIIGVMDNKIVFVQTLPVNTQ